MGRLHSAMAVVPAPAPEKDTAEIEYVRWIQQMQTDLAESVNGVLLRGARAVQVGTAAGSTARPTSAGGRVVGWSLHETTGAAPAVIRLWDGRSTDGALVAVVSLTQGQSTTHWLAPGGVSLLEGLFVEIVGSVEGAVYLGAAE